MISAADQADAERAKNLAAWKVRAAMTNEQLIAEWCENQRFIAEGQVKFIEQGIADRKKLDEDIRKYGEEG